MSKLKLLQQLDTLMQSGYTAFEYSKRRNESKGVKKWLAAWDVVKQLIELADSEINSPVQFDKVYPGELLQSVTNWSNDVEMELWNAGFYEQRIDYVREFLTCFPESSDDTLVSMKRAEAEAQWALGRQTEAEATYGMLVEQLPQKGWAYIGWSDQYYWGRSTVKNYEKAEEILLRAIDNPEIEDRRDVLERLLGLYEEWEQPEEKTTQHLNDLSLLLQEQIKEKELAQTELEHQIQTLRRELQVSKLIDNEKPIKLSRNNPCWCGSGKKYKHCHLKSDS